MGPNPPLSASASKPIRLAVELIRCGCRALCRGRCKCLRANLACTGLYNCDGNCKQPTVSLATRVDYINRLLNFG